MESNKPRRIGYYMSQSKLARLPWAEITAIALAKGCELVAVDLERDIAEQGPFDMLLYKVTDELVRGDDEKQQRKIANLEAYLASQQGKLIDAEPISKQRAIIDRQGISSLLVDVERQLPQALQAQIRSPRYAILAQKADDYSAALAAEEVHFPAIVKTIQACGSAASHEMGIVFQEKDLHAFELPLLVQEYYNHDAVVFKIFAVRDEVYIVRRPSLRNMGDDETTCITFNSQEPLPSTLFDKSFDVQDRARLADPPLDTVKHVAGALSATLGLSLLGFDMVTNTKTGQHAVIDVNYFPGYSGTPNFPELFVNFLLQRLNEA
ncbi:Rasrelated GTP-binding kinase [Acanthamoeba castellanii str. Neff]|uniref:Inositol-tetrakisphosphate 1-kinase n=1 Tax=Acanthamoeba castellanii (strain ATCC 30010 / Neff) TaxID=1257118 RepID=L8H6Y9_ACACF|nr:Rasrelated GTP-binding kinase [Acanthamoeba castellanii str. Neff]ELR20231.1 Rasrelated GTP-binding kinase [Acanthamoeba castellanii str. Neff]